MKKVFSGARSSGRLHLGNYLGAIKNWIELQNGADQAIFGVMDLHGITTPYDPSTYQEQVMATAMDYLAAGVDPKKSLLVRQSQIPQHTELMWLLNTITPVGWLERLPTYKEKVAQVEESGERGKSYLNNTGILTYPVLMAADILIYKSNLVPVGEDQFKHLDVANEIASKFNHLFGETFESVKPFKAEGARIMSLQDGTKKMSKTGDDAISLSDDADTVRTKIKKAQTDSGKEVRFNPEEKPAISNLITIYSLLSGEQIGEIEVMYQDKSYADFKSDLAEVVVEFLKPFQARYQELAKDPGYVLSVLKDSEEKARMIASTTLNDVKKKMGLSNG
jgi:tryptophanyl-tRNA synthetase